MTRLHCPIDTNSDVALSAAAKAQAENGTDSPQSSTPSTPEDQPRTGIRRPDTVKIASSDDLPDGKNGNLGQTTSSKSLLFSPRIQFHETWPSGEYDRRGDIATCNRLTPLLAQQIKEELNTFKMVGIIIATRINRMLTRNTGDGSSRNLENLHTLSLNAALQTAFSFSLRFSCLI